MSSKTVRPTGITATMNFNPGCGDEVLTIPIRIEDYRGLNIRDFCQELMHRQKIDCKVQDRFLRTLKDLIDNEIEKKEDASFEEETREDGSERSGKGFCSVMKAANTRVRESGDLSSRKKTSFWQRYHKLIHSGLLTAPLVALEHSLSFEIEKVVMERDDAIRSVSEHQTQEMEEMLSRVGMSVTEEDVNKLSVTHFAELDDLRKMWERSLRDQRNEQRREFELWITKVDSEFQEKGDGNEIAEKMRTRSKQSHVQEGDGQLLDSLRAQDLDQKNSMDESFTINLGAQLKTTHNLRLLSSNVLDICRSRDVANVSMPTPQRIQTAMSLYSHSLSALVLLVDNRVNSYCSLKKEFAALCERSTDLHFPSLEEQFSFIRRDLETRSATLSSGDFYITRHSNLSEIHAVFHLVSDESVLSADISSRHPLVMGLRNVLRTAYLSDVTTICLPLLLVHEMSENMTLQWCLRRAELVFKCVKGFMIEMASMTPTNEANRTLKFVLPEGIQDQLFSSLAAMLPSIFRLSNPLVLS